MDQKTEPETRGTSATSLVTRLQKWIDGFASHPPTDFCRDYLNPLLRREGGPNSILSLVQGQKPWISPADPPARMLEDEPETTKEQITQVVRELIRVVPVHAWVVRYVLDGLVYEALPGMQDKRVRRLDFNLISVKPDVDLSRDRIALVNSHGVAFVNGNRM